MRALQVDTLQRRRDLADGCKGLSSGSPLPMGFHSSSYYKDIVVGISVARSLDLGCIHSLDWTAGLEYRTGLLD